MRATTGHVSEATSAATAAVMPTGASQAGRSPAASEGASQEAAATAFEDGGADGDEQRCRDGHPAQRRDHDRQRRDTASAAVTPPPPPPRPAIYAGPGVR